MRQAIYTSIIALFVALFTLGAIFLPEPEEQVLISSDGRVTLSGLSRQSQEFTLDVAQTTYALPLLGPAYDIGPAGVVVDRPFTLVFASSESGAATDKLSILYYQEELEFWSPVPDFSQLNKDSLYVATASTGRYALALEQRIDPPNFLTAYDALLAMAPATTTGFATHVGYRLNNGPVIELPSLEQRGGCGGLFAEGDHRLISEITRQANILIDDVASDVTFVFRSVWSTTINAGCSSSAPLQSLAGA